MTIYSQGFYAAPEDQAEIPASGSRVIGATWDSITGPTRSLGNIIELDTARRRYGNAYKNYAGGDEAEEFMQSRGLEKQFEWDDRPYNELELSILANRKTAELKRAAVLSRVQPSVGMGAKQLGVSLAAMLVDPLNIAAGFIPVVGQARYAQMLGRAGSRLGRAGVRARVGALEGAVGNALVEPLIYGAHAQEQADYHLSDSLTNVLLGVPFGAAIHVGGGALADAFSYRAGMEAYAPEVRVTDEGVTIRDRVAPEIDVPKPAPGPNGSASQVRIGNRYVPIRWAVMEADDLAPTFQKADNQYRDRNREAAQAQVREIAADLDFNLLGHSPVMDFGAPTLTSDGAVVGGNGRLAAIHMVYKDGGGDRYRLPLVQQASQYGISAQTVSKMKRPVLVRVLKEKVDVEATAIASNEGAGLRMSPLEQSKVDAKRLGDLGAFEVTDDGQISLSRSMPGVRKWIGEFPKTEQASLLDADSHLSAEGVRRLRNAMLYKAYGDSPTLSRLIEAVDPGSRNMAAALMRVSTRIGELRDSIKAGARHDLDPSDQIQEAVEKLSAIRETGQSVDEALRQGGLFGQELTPEATAIVRFMGANLRSSRALADFLGRYLDGVEAAGNPKQADFLGGAGVPTKLELLERSAAQYVPSAAEQVELALPANRLAATKAAIVQSVQDQPIQVDAILTGDEAGIRALAAKADNPDTKLLNDPVASRLADEEIANQPIGESAELAAAEKALAEAQLELADVVDDLTAAGVLDAPKGDVFAYTPQEGLTPEQQAIEKRFGDWIAEDPERAIAAYAAHDEAMGGKYLSADVARELSPAYLADRSLSAVIHEPASSLVKLMYARRLKAPLGKGEKRVVLFSAGGTGAGKTSSFKLKPDEIAKAHVIYDGNMDSVASASGKFEQALDAKHKVRVLYTYRDPIDALEFALSRAMRQEAEHQSGRTVPIDTHLSTHIGSNQTVRQLAAKYGADERFKFLFTNNSFGKGKAKIIEPEDLPDLRWEAYDDYRERAVKTVETGLAEGRVSQKVAAGFLDSTPAPAGRRVSEVGAVDGGRPQRGVDQRDDAGRSLSDEALAALPDDLRAEAEQASLFSDEADETAELARRAAACASRAS